MRIQCPDCDTSYSPKRCGLDLQDQIVSGTTVCALCGKTFDFTYTPGQTDVVITPRGWFQRTVLRRPDVVTTKVADPTIKTLTRKQ